MKFLILSSLKVMSSYQWGRNKLFLLIAQLYFGHFSDIFTANSFSMFNSNILKFLQMQDFPAITNIECLSPGCKVSGTNGLRVIVKWRGRTQRRPIVCIGRSAHGIGSGSTALVYCINKSLGDCVAVSCVQDEGHAVRG